MRNKEEDVDEEGEESDEESRDRENQQREEVAWRMARTVKVSGHRETEADQREQSGDRVNDKDRGETVSRRRRERKVRLCIWAGEQAICAIPNLRSRTPSIIIAPPQHSKIIALKATQRYSSHDGCGNRAEEEEDECDEEDDGQWRRGA